VDDSTFITRVRLNNYKSIEKCDVHLRPLLFLVGPNGSGKSNFLDALRFVADALDKTLDHALRDRGGIKEVRRRSGGHPNHFTIKLNFKLSDGTVGDYTFRIGAQPQGGYEVQSEECKLNKPTASFVPHIGRSLSTNFRHPGQSATDEGRREGPRGALKARPKRRHPPHPDAIAQNHVGAACGHDAAAVRAAPPHPFPESSPTKVSKPARQELRKNLRKRPRRKFSSTRLMSRQLS
jgi:AAA ATPase domain